MPELSEKSQVVKPILIPVDFSAASLNAIDFGIKLAKLNQNPLIFIHIITKAKENAIKQGKLNKDFLWKQLTEIASIVTFSSQLKVSVLLLNGSIFSTINKVAEEKNCSLVVLANRGIRNFYQQLFRPYALRLVAKSNVNYLLVNEKSKIGNFKNIVVTIDESSEVVNSLTPLIQLASLFQSTIHLLIHTTNDEIIKKQINDNLNNFRENLNKNGIMFFIMQQPAAISFTDFILNYAEELLADLIIINVQQKPDFSSAINEEQIINNEKHIPVLCIPNNHAPT